jgi:hypothetical protein
VVDEQIDPHPRRRPKHGRQPERDHIFLFQQRQLGVAFRTAIHRDWFERAVLGAERVTGPNAITAVRIRINDQLRRRPQFC